MKSSIFNRRRFLGTLGTFGAFTITPQLVFAESKLSRKLGVALVGLGRYSTGQLGPALKLWRLNKLNQGRNSTLVVEEPCFPFDSSCKSRKSGISADHSVTGNNNRERIMSDGCTNGTNCFF
jgi:hypothetical protein